MEAVRDFDIGSLDFVYIDANHKFRYIAEDIYEWAKRVRSGGIVSGHDYAVSIREQVEVQYVVDAYIKTYNIKNWYLTTKDKWPSWLWIKK